MRIDRKEWWDIVLSWTLSDFKSIDDCFGNRLVRLSWQILLYKASTVIPSLHYKTLRLYLHGMNVRLLFVYQCFPRLGVMYGCHSSRSYQKKYQRKSLEENTCG